MRRPCSAAGVLLIAALALCLISVVDATVVTICRAATSSDARVDSRFCVAELGNHRDSPDADPWGLAKVAALTGVNNADDAVYDIKAVSLARQCDAAMARAHAAPSPVARYSSYSVKIGAVCAAITNLVK